MAESSVVVETGGLVLLRRSSKRSEGEGAEVFMLHPHLHDFSITGGKRIS